MSEHERDPLEATQEIREKVAEGEEPSPEEQEFLEAENVELESDRSERRSSDLTG
ncbi:MAG: hypothetical protein M3312_11290 [Actinomycetota bacterium]|nr:hypothetical protein [Actinomycetota bacterium]